MTALEGFPDFIVFQGIADATLVSLLLGVRERFRFGYGIRYLPHAIRHFVLLNSQSASIMLFLLS
jgi:hypothetical protein